MNRIPVTRVTLNQQGQSEITVTTIAEANTYILAHPQARIEFKVYWQDGTAQLGRVMGKSISDWIRDWLSMAFDGLSTLSESALKARLQLQRDPKLVAHAKLLRDKLQVN